jgi:HD superfamily phosphohydrolase
VHTESTWLETEEWERLPLFPDLPPCPSLLMDAREAVFADPFLAELALSQPVQRLTNIGFLGALDYIKSCNGTDNHRRRHNRYDHSLGVAELAILYADIRGLSRYDTRILAAAGLLHDVGHGPLSHTLEPVFNSAFGVNHHEAGRSIVYGASSLGSEIPEIMAGYGIDLDEVLAMIEGRHEGKHAFLYAGPINLDTIEGISRSRLFAAKATRPFNPKRLVALIAASDEWPVKATDDFWRLKDEVYNLVIHHPQGLLFDGLAQAYMTHEIDQFRPNWFQSTEHQLRYRHGQHALFHIFAWARKSKRRAFHRLSEWSPKLLDFEIKAPTRSFHIREEVQISKPTDQVHRYFQRKSSRGLTVADLVGMGTTEARLPQ